MYRKQLKSRPVWLVVALNILFFTLLLALTFFSYFFPVSKQHSDIKSTRILKSKPNKPRILVALARHNEDIAWVTSLGDAYKNHPHADVIFKIYQTPGQELLGHLTKEAAQPFAYNHTIHNQPYTQTVQDPSVSPSLPLYLTPVNRGCEAMAYLSAIIDAQKEGLPYDYMIFMHAHWLATHSHLTHDWLLAQLTSNAHNLKVYNDRYMSLQCGHIPPGWERWFLADPVLNEDAYKHKYVMYIARGWDDLITNTLGLGNRPDFLVSPPNSEFIITRTAISQYREDFWVKLRHWLLTTDKFISLDAGMAMEYLWAYLFTGGETVVDVPQHQCMCDLYGVCVDTDVLVNHHELYGVNSSFKASIEPEMGTTYLFPDD
jgi:hypothetical protein